jgi:glyoxylase I family protein
MPIDHVLAVVPVADFEAAHAWYERLFGRPADNLPMEGRLVEWRVTDSVADAAARGLAPGAIETVNKGVQLSAIRDPDGNTITFIGNFRVHY